MLARATITQCLLDAQQRGIFPVAFGRALADDVPQTRKCAYSMLGMALSRRWQLASALNAA